MRDWVVHLYSCSVTGLRGVLPILASLMAIRAEHTHIATSIPGLGECRSTFCKPERRNAVAP